jgi:hypothetical protein
VLKSIRVLRAFGFAGLDPLCGARKATPSITRRGTTLTMRTRRQSAATHDNSFGLVGPSRGRSICDWLPLVATARLHERSILCSLSRQQTSSRRIVLNRTLLSRDLPRPQAGASAPNADDLRRRPRALRLDSASDRERRTRLAEDVHYWRTVAPHLQTHWPRMGDRSTHRLHVWHCVVRSNASTATARRAISAAEADSAHSL